jgi:hypothetical protein
VKYHGVNPSKIPSSELWAIFRFPAISAERMFFGTLYIHTYVRNSRRFSRKKTVSERRISAKSKTRIPDKEILHRYYTTIHEFRPPLTIGTFRGFIFLRSLNSTKTRRLPPTHLTIMGGFIFHPRLYLFVYMCGIP